MTGKTHKQYSTGLALIVAMIMYQDTAINYYLMLVIIVPISIYGGLVPDMDDSWGNISSKTVVNWFIHKFIKLLGVEHRGWLTHSLDIVLVGLAIAVAAPINLYTSGVIDRVNMEVLLLLGAGFMAGWLSHLIADMLTVKGVHLVCWSKFRVRVVPKSIFGFRFNTGGAWESLIQRVNMVIGTLIEITAIIFPLIYSGWFIRVAERIIGGI